MIPEIGLLFLVLAFTISSFYVFGNTFSFYRNNIFIISPKIVYLFFFSVLLSFICLEISFLTDDFSVLYVANNSNENLPDYYKFAALWGGHEGSMLLYLLFLSLWTLIFYLKSQSSFGIFFLFVIFSFFRFCYLYFKSIRKITPFLSRRRFRLKSFAARFCFYHSSANSLSWLYRSDFTFCHCYGALRRSKL